MCGIYGYIGPRSAVEQCVAGLRRLEYRGYDSAGVACLIGDRIVHTRRVGKLAELEAALDAKIPNGQCAIAHTRWATHGIPTELNAHPQLDSAESVAVVHNGIIENHATLRAELELEGTRFASDTDTEVVAQLLARHYQGDLLRAVQAVVERLRGAWALAVTHRLHPGQMVVTAHDSPLAIGVGGQEMCVASDPQAFPSEIQEVVHLVDGDMALLEADGYRIVDRRGVLAVRESVQLTADRREASKSGYEHFMLKEIFEQPQTLRSAMLGRLDEECGTASLEGLQHDLVNTRRVLMLACGGAWHAGYVGSYMIEELARVPAQCEIGSELRYKDPIVEEGTLVIAISQSGETADTLAAARELKAKGAKVIAVCNVAGSTLTRLADSTLITRAGPEIAVASTKAYTAQLVVLGLLALQMGRARHLDRAAGLRFIAALKGLPRQVEQVLADADKIRSVAERYARFNNFFQVGRRYMFPTALEGALKLKEISYANANGYPAGELKHGVIALIGPDCPTVAYCCDAQTRDKVASNLMEIKARSGPIVAIVPTGCVHFDAACDDKIEVPGTIDPLAAIPATVAGQLFAYYVAKARGTDIDQPRNLAKSVTVE